MTRRRWLLAAVLILAAFGFGLAAAVGSDRVLLDRSGYIRRDPALPSPSYTRRPMWPLPSDRWIPTALETR